MGIVSFSLQYRILGQCSHTNKSCPATFTISGVSTIALNLCSFSPFLELEVSQLLIPYEV